MVTDGSDCMRMCSAMSRMRSRTPLLALGRCSQARLEDVVDLTNEQASKLPAALASRYLTLVGNLSPLHVCGCSCHCVSLVV